MNAKEAKAFCLGIVKRWKRERVFKVTSHLANGSTSVVWFRSEEKAREWSSMLLNVEIHEVSMTEDRMQVIRLLDEVRHVVNP